MNLFSVVVMSVFVVSAAGAQSVARFGQSPVAHDSRNEVPGIAVKSPDVSAKSPALSKTTLSSLNARNDCFALRTYQFKEDGLPGDSPRFSGYTECQPVKGRHFKSAVVTGKNR